MTHPDKGLAEWAGGSCGCRLRDHVEVDDLPISDVGISIYPGKCGKEKKTESQEVVHVETSAGPITLNLRYAKFGS